MADYILRLTVGDGSAVAFIADTKETVNEAAAIHKTSPVVSAALGRMLTASAMMGLQLKHDDDIITLNIKGDGPLGGLVVTSDKNGRVKGYPFNSNVELPLNNKNKLDVSRAVGAGHLNVIKDLGLKEPYVGTVPLVSGEIGEDLAYYFTVSEQIPSAVGLGVLVDVDYSIKQAGGFLVQMMPGAADTLIDELEQRIAAISSVTSFYEDGKTPYDMAEYLFEGYSYNINDRIDITYCCNCSRERVEKALISLGEAEIEKILIEDRQAVLHCHFCSTDYKFSENDLEELLHSLKE